MPMTTWRSSNRQSLSLDLAGDLALDARPCRRGQHDEPVEFLLRPRVRALALLRCCSAVRREPQQMLRALQPLLRLDREVAAPPPDRLRLRDIERGDVFAYGVAIFELSVAVAEDV